MNQVGSNLPKIYGIRIHLEDQEMNKLSTGKFSYAKLEREKIKNSDDNLEFCHVCFIALGSQ